MGDFDDNNSFETGDVLHIDGDILAFQACCIIRDEPIKLRLRQILIQNRPEIADKYSDLSKTERAKALDKEATAIIPKEIREKVRQTHVDSIIVEDDLPAIMKIIERNIDDLLVASGCDTYRIFLTGSTNFRDDLVADYKANRDKSNKPPTLAAAKYEVLGMHNTTAFMKLEADDLLGIHMADNVVIWSLDKDLRQIPGRHLDDATRKVYEVTKFGYIKDLGKKFVFDGLIGFYFQLLTGDTTDHIVGCGVRKEMVYKSGAKKGQDYIKRVGIGPKAAFQILAKALLAHPESQTDGMYAALAAVMAEYQKIHGDYWQHHLEVQGNLLFMIREQHSVNHQCVKKWTYDDRVQWFNLREGLNCADPEAD